VDRARVRYYRRTTVTAVRTKRSAAGAAATKAARVRTTAPKKAAAASSAPSKAKKATPKAAKHADDGRGDRSKRLLDLVMLLLRARTPVTYREVREQFPGYQTGNPEAGLRAFERDKADLLDLGVPIRYITPEEDDSLEDGGYVIDLKRFRMPEVRLTADEVSALVLAASVARAMPGGAYPKIVDLALKKLAFDLPELPDTPTDFPRQTRAAAPSPAPVLVHFPEKRASASKEIGENFAELESAIRYRKRVTFTYQAAGSGTVSKREVDPYGLVYRDAAWVLVGWCHLRKEVRSFRVDRMHEVVMAPKPKSPDFERPAGFDVREHANRSPWTFAVEPAEDVELEIRPEAADTAHDDFGASAKVETRGELTVVRFACTNPDFAVSKILAAKGAIVVRKGDRLRKRLATELDALAQRYA
jgi:proteasome accessory factor B